MGRGGDVFRPGIFFFHNVSLSFCSYLYKKKCTIAFTLVLAIIFWQKKVLKFIYQNFREIRLGISCESSAQQTVHMKCQVSFSLKKNVICCHCDYSTLRFKKTAVDIVSIKLYLGGKILHLFYKICC